METSNELPVRRKNFLSVKDEWEATDREVDYQEWLEWRVIDLESKLDPFYWSRAESDAWHQAIPDIRKAFQDLRAVDRNANK